MRLTGMMGDDYRRPDTSMTPSASAPTPTSASASAIATAKATVEASPAPATTRDRLVEVARQLFLAKGYEGTGVAEILREAGVNSGSLYHFFRTKERLLLAVLDRYVEMLHPAVIDPVFVAETDPISRIFGVLDGYRQMLLMTGCKQGCPIGNLALEMSEKSDAVRERIALNLSNWSKVIEQCLRDAGDRLPAGVDRAHLATFVLAVMEGGVMLARAHRSIDPFDEAVGVLRNYFDRLTGGAGAGVAGSAGGSQKKPRGKADRTDGS